MAKIMEKSKKKKPKKEDSEEVCETFIVDEEGKEKTIKTCGEEHLENNSNKSSITEKSTQLQAFATGIEIKECEQYQLRAVFAYSAESPYLKGRHWFRWDSNWPNPYEDLYYRVGTGPWIKLNNEALIQYDSFHEGKLEFYLDKQRIWEKLPKEFREPRLGGVMSARFPYKKFYPQFHIKVTGRRFIKK